jgi:hypothetical protein
MVFDWLSLLDIFSDQIDNPTAETKAAIWRPLVTFKHLDWPDRKP